MRALAGLLVISGLGTLSWAGLAQHDLSIAGPGITLGALWGLAMALRWPKAFHTACLGTAAFLCVLSVLLKMPALIPLFCISASLYGWDLVIMDLRLRSHRSEATSALSRKYAIRCLVLASVGAAVTLGARTIHVELSFFTAFAMSCLCIVLFLIIHRSTHKLMVEKPSERDSKRKADG